MCVCTVHKKCLNKCLIPRGATTSWHKVCFFVLWPIHCVSKCRFDTKPASLKDLFYGSLTRLQLQTPKEFLFLFFMNWQYSWFGPIPCCESSAPPPPPRPRYVSCFHFAPEAERIKQCIKSGLKVSQNKPQVYFCLLHTCLLQSLCLSIILAGSLTPISPTAMAEAVATRNTL